MLYKHISSVVLSYFDIMLGECGLAELLILNKLDKIVQMFLLRSIYLISIIFFILKTTE